MYLSQIIDSILSKIQNFKTLDVLLSVGLPNEGTVNSYTKLFPFPFPFPFPMQNFPTSVFCTIYLNILSVLHHHKSDIQPPLLTRCNNVKIEVTYSRHLSVSGLLRFYVTSKSDA